MQNEIGAHYAGNRTAGADGGHIGIIVEEDMRDTGGQSGEQIKK